MKVKCVSRKRSWYFQDITRNQVRVKDINEGKNGVSWGWEINRQVGSWRLWKGAELNSSWSEKALEAFKQLKNVIWFTFLGDHSGCYLEEVLKQDKNLRRRTKGLLQKFRNVIMVVWTRGVVVNKERMLNLGAILWG